MEILEGFEDWKKQRIKTLKQNLEYHKNKVEDIRKELSVYEVII